MEIFSNGQWLPLVFALLMGISMVTYAVLDGYDLGVGILMRGASEAEQNRMISSIGPFWDANETWLVLGVGLLLVAFPMAHGIILSSLYLPVAIMLAGLILRGVAFDFRVKAKDKFRATWNHAFFAGSLITAIAQGYMLGSYILGFDPSWTAMVFSLFVGLCLSAGYALIGAAWLIMKTDGELQKKAVRWAKGSLVLTCLGIAVVSAATPLVSPRIFEKWFTMPNLLVLAPIPVITAVLVSYMYFLLHKLPKAGDRHCWVPFVTTIGIYVLCFLGMAYSFFPYIVPDRLLITEAASAPESLMIILVGALVVLPMMIAYTIFAYRVFWGKAGDDLSYD